MAADVEVLVGGVNRVVRVGDTVRRPTGAWSGRVHELLKHLGSRGFGGAPRFHGLTDDGEEVLDFIAGEVSNYPLTPAAASEEALVTAAELLRDYHAATADLAAAIGRDGWLLPAREPVEVVCHGDFAPYNCVLQGNRTVAMIDFDVAHPGPRLWDVAYGVYRWVPLSGEIGAEQRRRARLFCDRYGLDQAGRDRLAETVVERLHAMVDFMHAEAKAGNAAFAGHIRDGHDTLYLNDAAMIAADREGLLGRG